MTYLKTLITLTTLALLTACAGGVAVNNTFNSGIIAPCVANPFGAACTNATETQEVTFCRDNTKTTNTKIADCAPVAIRVCNGNVFDKLCPNTPTDPQAEAFCGDDTKTTDSKTDDCAPTVMRVCGANIFDPLCTNHATEQLAFCRDDTKTSPTKANDCANTVNLACNANIFDTICTTATPMQEAAFCRDDSKTTATKANDCADTITRVCGANIYDTLCNGDPQYTNQRDAIRLQCIADGRGETVCDMEALMARCTGNPFTQECEADYGDLRRSTCASEINESRCTGTVALVCNADKFDTYCIGANAYKNAQIGDCADATATLATCNMFFTGNLAGCLQDPFSVACHTEPTFTDRASVRTSRFNYCKTDQTSDARCVGYTTCNVSATFAPITCGTDFNSARMMFCGTTANAFDSLCITNNLIDTGAQMAYCMVTAQAFDDGCVGGLEDAAAQLAFCKLSTSDPFGTDCGGMAFKEARVEFCIAKPSTLACDTDLHGEDLMYVADPCLTNDCVDLADLPTYPTTPAENDPVGTAFASGFLRATLNPLAEGTPLLNPSGTENSTIDLTPFPTGTVVREEGLRFGRRGGLGSIDDDGFVNFRLLKAGAEGESTRSSVHSAILPTTSLGAPLASPPMTALWPGHYYPTRGGIRPANFYITFDTSLNTGAINFANIAGDGIGAGDTRQDFVKSLLLTLTAAFDANGVITGTLSQLGDFLIGAPILGLIGTEGLVAAASSGAGAAGFTATNPDGGAAPVIDRCIALLMADNCANIATWEASFDTGGVNEDETLQESGFRNTGSGTSDYIKLDGDTIKIVNATTSTDIPRTFTPNILRLNETVDADGYESGIAYTFNNQDYNGQTYAGILATTNLGAPLTDGTKDGRWTGRLGGEYGSDTPIGAASFSMLVTWNGSSTEPGSMGTIKSLPNASSTTPGAAAITGAYNEMNFSGDFNAAGVMWGDVALGTASANDGKFSGLIGAKGAVGVFRGIDDNVGNTAYAGGFVVTPPTN